MCEHQRFVLSTIVYTGLLAGGAMEPGLAATAQTKNPCRGKVLILVFEGFEYFETRVPWLRLAEEGYAVEFVSKARGRLRGGHDLEVNVALTFEEVVPSRYAALLIPGGAAAGYPGKELGHPGVTKVVTGFQEEGKPVAAICMGVGVLAKTGVLKGVKAACDPSTVDLLRECGGEYVNERVVTSGPFITSRFWPDLTDYCQTLIATLRRSRPVLMILGPGFEDVHVRGTFYRVREDGYRLALAGPDQKLWEGKAKLHEKGVLIGRGGVGTWGVPGGLESIDVEAYSGLFLPGGRGAVDVLKRSPDVLGTVKAFVEAKLPIAAAGEGVEIVSAAAPGAVVADAKSRFRRAGMIMTASDTGALPQLWREFVTALSGPTVGLPKGAE